MNRFFKFFSLFLILLIPMSASATTMTAVQEAALIQTLYAEVQQLEAKITVLQSGDATVTSSHSCSVTFDRTLGLSMSGSDVTALQNYLIAQGYLSSPATGYFGTLTQAALQQLQKDRGIVSSGTPRTTGFGAIGPKTQAYLATVMCSATTTSSTSTVSTTSVSTVIQVKAAGTPSTIVNFTPTGAGGGGGGGGGSAPTPTPTPTPTPSPSPTLLPSVTITAPATNLAANTTQTTLAATTNEAATCRYSTASSFTFAQGTLFTTTGGTSHSTTLTGLENGTSYTYYVKCQDAARNISGNISGNASVVFSVASLADTVAPSVPTGLFASAISSSQINLTWAASTDNVSVTGYNVYRNGTMITTSATNSYSDTGLTASTAYSYTVSAYDAAGNTSTQSNAASATTQAIVSSGGGGSGSNPSVTDAYGTVWHDLRIGAGGWLVGMDIAPDGTKVVRTDTYGAYIWNGTQWQQLVTASSMPSGFVNIAKNSGVQEIRIAPSNSNILYMMYLGYVFKTTNHGATWTQTSFAQVANTANDSYRMDGEKMAIDPANPNIVYAGTEASGVFVTTNGGTTWTNISAISAGSGAGITGIAFDPSSGTTGGATNTIYIGSWGKGVYVSTNAGSTWTLTTSGPTEVENSIVANGIYYAAGNSAFWSYSGGAWNEMESASGQGAHSIAVDPSNPLRIIGGGEGGTFNISMDGGKTWTGWIWGGAPATTRTATDIPWLAWTNATYLSNGNMIFDPTASNKLYFSQGIGVWYTNYPTSGITWQTGTSWISQSAGIEQLVSNEIISPPGGSPLVFSWDRPVFESTNPDVYPSVHGPNNAHAIIAGWSGDWASSNPSFIVGDMDYTGAPEESAYSTNGGQTWTNFASFPPGTNTTGGGSIAAASPTNIVWIPAHGGGYYTQDGGTSWTQISGPTLGGWAYYLNRQIIAADRVNIGTFYLFDGSNFWESTDGGVTWTKTHTGVLEGGGADGWNAVMRTVPNETGNLFFTAGSQSGMTLAHSENETFWRSTDGGTTWTAVSNVKSVFTFGFGAPASSGGYPSIYIVGYINNIFGIWRSTDNANTWTQVGLWPMDSLDHIKTISGDMNQYGRFYVGFSGSGYMYGDNTSGGTVTAQPPTATLSANPTSITSGNSSTLTWSSTNATSCTGTGLSTGGETSGSVSVSPSTSTTYSISCTGIGGTSPITSATVSVTSPQDTTPPTVTVTAPSGQLAASTTQTTLSVKTNENATCAWSNTQGVTFASMAQFSSTGGTVHSTTLTGLTNGSSYTTYVECEDAAGNISGASSASYSVAASGGGSGSVTWTPTASPAAQNLDYSSKNITFSNVNIGTAAPRRIVVVGMYNSQGSFGGQIKAVTIGGVSATAAVISGDMSIWYATVPTGTTATISATLSILWGIGDIEVGTITGASSAAPSSTSMLGFTYIKQPQSFSVTVPSNGVGVVFGLEGMNSATTPPVPSWTNAMGDYTTNDTTDARQFLLAHTVTAGSQTISITSGNVTTYNYAGTAFVAASWAP